MPSVYDIKPAFQAFLRPVSGFLFRKGITPNQITTAACILSVLTGWILYKYHTNNAAFLILPVFLFIRMSLNAIDGMLAREHNMKTNLGALLNELGDIVSDCALYLPFAAIDEFNPSAVIAAVILSCISEAAGIAAVQIGASRRYDGPMGKSDRALTFGIIGTLLGCGVKAGPWCEIVMWCITAALLLTIVNRVRKSLEEAG